MYDYIEKITKSTNLPPQDVRDIDGNELDEELYNEELLRLQRSRVTPDCSKACGASNHGCTPMDRMHIDFKCMVVVSDRGKVIGHLALSSFHNMYHLKTVEAKCNKEYLDNFNVKFPKSYKLMKE